MRRFQLLLSLALVATALGIAQDGTPSPNAAGTPEVVNPAPQSSSIRILTPVAGQTLNDNFVNLRFELARPALDDEPNFLVQLDARDPITTTSTSYTFADLQPGIHTVRVTLVDANNNPIQGGAATVQFKVPASNAPARTDVPHGAKLHSTQTVIGAAPTAPVPSELRKDEESYLPLAGSPLPLLSLIGFGLLIGGAAHTMRSR